jgi:Ca2+-binding RTX toxin-like protein
MATGIVVDLGSGAVTGTPFDDTLLGTDGDNLFDLSAGGSDTVDGRGGFDHVSYGAATLAVSVDLDAQRVDLGDGSVGQLRSIERLTGTAFADELLGRGGGGFEQFDGGAGNDTIDARPGGRGKVTFAGAVTGIVVDLVAGTAEDGQGGRDLLRNIDEIDGTAFADTLIGGDGNNKLTGFAGDDRIAGGSGDDELAGYAGADSLDGGDGNDFVIYRFEGGSNPVLVDLAAGIAVDSFGDRDRLSGFEEVRGTDRGPDILLGSDADESFRPFGGNDTIDGRGGLDRVDYAADNGAVIVSLRLGTARDGFGGRDRLIGIESARGSNNADRLVGDDGVNRLSGLGGNDRIDGGGDGDTLEGEGGDDRLDGGDGNDTLLGGDGDDLLRGAAGDDSVDGGGGVDLVLGGDGDDALEGGDQGDQLRGEAGNDRLLGGGDNDRLEGGDGADSLDGGDGDDLLLAGAGADRLLGGAGNDLLRGGDGADSLDGGDGRDRLDGEAGNDLLRGGGGDDRLDGGLGRDVLIGGSGNDRLSGGDDDDALAGNAGVDLLVGGAGRDRFVFFRADEGPDRILDFADDVLDLRRLVAAPAPGEPLADLVRLDAVGDDAALQVNVDGAGFVPLARLDDAAGLSVEGLLAAGQLLLG